MKRHLALLTAIIMCPIFMQAQPEDGTTDKQQLGIALDYFAAGKYREALNLFTRLDKRYKLNPRFKAYIGLCHYYEWEYKEACKYLDPAIEHLDVYAPHERSIYYFACAESHFHLAQYAEAMPLYEKQLSVCYDKEKGDAFYRLGFCHMFAREWSLAAERLQSALDYYERFGYPTDRQARVEQIKKMLRGCQENARAEEEAKK